jgi:UDP-N-acetylglucosamine 3-dehydrogenase
VKKLGVAVIGTGFWGKNHARVYKELNSTELIAVCDVNPKRANSIANQFNVKAYTNTSKMLKNKKIDAVSVCTWSTKLAKEAKKSLKMKKHVLVEKPMATNSKQAKNLIETANENSVCLAVGFLMRFIPGLKRIKEANTNNEIGDMVCATAKRVSQWPERIGDVGVVKDTAIHDIDIMKYITGEDPIGVYAKTGNMKHRKFEDYAQIMLTYKDGKSAFIESNWLTPYKTRELVVTGSKAIMKLDYITQELLIEKQKKTIKPKYEFKEPLKLELDHFVNCINKIETPIISGLDGLKALKIAEAALKSSIKGRAIKLVW